ncbi:EPIDERMAL PATTERNING FACTOR-like protein 6 isoform X2 [Salvia splendens]|uniref:EPIDERMAL PATTERNING FACTOR-like protein 6 isoform X2 n=1 Tax=Salvia splendens TaxID=180675 RepID=UPI001C26082B|nr:EPIDERMAL PATTERNING FACTOR-like protein 6 isoform X2 [Salvia splendens]
MSLIRLVLSTTMTRYLPLYALFSFFLCFLCFHGFFSANHHSSSLSDIKFLFNLKADANHFLKNIEKSNMLEIGGGRVRGSSIGPRRLLLGGPGSSPPRCAWKCGGCMPCKPVHAPVPPGARVTTEYYPEAWRCKCGNKLYMP